jgi:hypothetical protein
VLPRPLSAIVEGTDARWEEALVTNPEKPEDPYRGYWGQVARRSMVRGPS